MRTKTNTKRTAKAGHGKPSSKGNDVSTINDLVPTLAKLPRHEYADLIRQVDEQRRQAAVHEAAAESATKRHEQA